VDIFIKRDVNDYSRAGDSVYQGRKSGDGKSCEELEK
jgi:hypothetical protein